ncbi:TPA: hypothetical protein EYP66_13835 [Candidatus Poribacteria bacterium]|nr:hypothetical protein [Candidatus Poribacteria bacterium]
MDTPELWRKLVRVLEDFIDWQLHRQFLMGIDLTLLSLINVTECNTEKVGTPPKAAKIVGDLEMSSSLWKCLKGILC